MGKKYSRINHRQPPSPFGFGVVEADSWAPCLARRLVQQQRSERALRLPEQERPGQQEQEQRFSGCRVHIFQDQGFVPAGTARRRACMYLFRAEAKNGGVRSRARLARLRLTVHPGTHPRPVAEGIPFLGFVVYPGRRRLKRRKGIWYRRRLRGLVAAYRAGEIPLEQLGASVRGWLNHARYGNTVGLRKALLQEAFGGF